MFEQTPQSMSKPPMYEQEAPAPIYTPPQDALPSYVASHEFFGVALTKTEFFTPYHYNNGNRSWKPVILELNSTQLNMYSLNVNRKLSELIVCLYSELNSLHELVKNVNNDFKASPQVRGDAASLDEFLGGDCDMFGADAYGGIDGSLSDQYLTKMGKLKTNMKSYKASKALNHLAKSHGVLCDNQLLFEPIKSREQYHEFKKQYQGNMLHSFTLSNLQVGEAPSLNQVISAICKEEKIGESSHNLSLLVKYKNILRVRLEYKQVLLQFWSFSAMTHWFRMLTIGRDLSIPLDLRSVTRLKSIPSHNTRRNNALLTATAAAANYRLSSVEDEHEDSLDALFRNTYSSMRAPVSFVDPFSAGQNIEKLPFDKLPIDHSSPCNGRSDSIESIPDSIFENSDCCRSSVASTNTTLSICSRTDTPTNCKNIKSKYSTTINKHKFISYDRYYTLLEKQYISNCIPDLNSFDKWNGKLITLSDYPHFVDHELSKSSIKNDDLFIAYNSLAGLVQSYDRKVAKSSNTAGQCRNFYIHASGLVSVRPDKKDKKTSTSV